MHPNKGFGEPGSLRWHKLHVEECMTLKGIRSYVNKVTGKPLVVPLSVIKEAAINVIKEFKAHG